MHIIIPGTDCQTKEALFTAFAKAANFPDYFSNNWDSFEEILQELPNQCPDLQSLILLDSDVILMDDPLNKEIFEDILTGIIHEKLFNIYYAHQATYE